MGDSQTATALAKLQQKNRKRKRKISRVLSEFRESTSALPDATVVLDSNRAVQWWNEKANEKLGFDRKKCRGKSIRKLLKDPVFRAYLDAGDFSRPIQMPAPLDDGMTLEVRIVPFGQGKLLLQARDISRLAQLETIRSDFVANVSHEMRTPLTVVHGYLESMLHVDDDGLNSWRGIIEQMYQQSVRMQRIVEDLLLISRLESENDDRSLSQFDLRPLLSAVRDEAITVSGEDNHNITLEIEGNTTFTGVLSEIDSAFSNLVLNAVRYTPVGGEIQIRWQGSDGKACFSVTDTGIGIAADHIPRLTERFHRVDVGRSRSSGGTGLGLAIVKHVLLRHGSELQIESELGKGSTFSCCFPQKRVVH
jgi:two-component system phosphate regulon sensor histidine kinase PhoR